MALDRRRKNRQRAMFVATDRIRAPGHPFYRARAARAPPQLARGDGA